jgi:hypothetical protein
VPWLLYTCKIRSSSAPALYTPTLNGITETFFVVLVFTKKKSASLLLFIVPFNEEVNKAAPEIE